MDGAGGTGLTGFIEELTRLREENRALAARIESLERDGFRGGSSHSLWGTARDGDIAEPGRRISRRDLIKTGGLAAAGAAALIAGDAVTTRSRAEATVGTMMYGTSNDAGISWTALRSTSSVSTLIVSNGSTLPGAGLQVDSTNGPAIDATGRGDRATLQLHNFGTGPCVSASVSSGADGIHVVTDGVGNAIYGETSDIGQGVQGRATGQGYGVVGHTASDFASGVYGTTTGGGAGVQGASSGDAPGLKASSKLGRGAVLSSQAVAPLQLAPSDAATHPQDGLRGDLFVDKKGHLWFCRKGGATATWKKLA